MKVTALLEMMEKSSFIILDESDKPTRKQTEKRTRNKTKQPYQQTTNKALHHKSIKSLKSKL
jgi:hypothetical protein